MQILLHSTLSGLHAPDNELVVSLLAGLTLTSVPLDIKSEPLRTLNNNTLNPEEQRACSVLSPLTLPSCLHRAFPGS